MLTDNDIYFFWNKYPNRKHVAIAIGLNGKVIVDLVTYIDFQFLLNYCDNILPINKDCTMIKFMKNGFEIETLKTSSFMGSLLCSKPDILEIYRPPNQEQYDKNNAVSSGWLYDLDGNFRLPYEGWDTEVIDGMSNSDREHNALEYYTGD
jgi:hypothetical protein